MANSQFRAASSAPAPTLRRAAIADIDAVMALERLPGYAMLVGRSEHSEHQAMMEAPRCAYWLGFQKSIEPLAFAILRAIDHVHGHVYLLRVAVRTPGQGQGGAFLAEVIDRAFDDPGAHRFYLDCFVENYRARRAYAKLGLTHEGILREAYRTPDGTRRDLVVMAITRPEWLARRSAS